MSAKWRLKVLIWIPIFLFASSVLVNVLQAQRIRSLLDEGRGPSLIGRLVPDLSGHSVTGDPRRLAFRGGLPTVVYFFSPSCPWCERNWPNVEALNKGAGKHYRLIAVSSATNLKKYLEQRQLTIDVIEGLSDDDVASFGFSGTPHTVVVSADGQVTTEWRGAFSARIERQLEAQFQVVLPGIRPAGQSLIAR
jgi:hypothetical protein